MQLKLGYYKLKVDYCNNGMLCKAVVTTKQNPVVDTQKIKRRKLKRTIIEKLLKYNGGK